MPPLAYHSAVVFVKDIEVAKKFYLGLLGQEVALDFGKCVGLRCGISLWELNDSLSLGRRLGDTIHDRRAVRFELCFETQNFDADYASLREAGVEFLQDLLEEPWGQRVVRFLDPDGHLLEMGETIPTFVLRHYRSGMTLEEVAAKTFVPLEMVREIVNAAS